MPSPLYSATKLFSRFVRRQCLREFILHGERIHRPGGYLLAPTHVSHIEPMLISSIFERPIQWMARKEFYQVPVLATALRHLDAFCVNRQGVPVSAIRTAIRLAREERVVGIFPEGGCRKGRHLVFRGGRIKQGICLIATRAQVPIVPAIVLGTHALNEIDPWLPGLTGQVWLAFGNAIHPPPIPAMRDRKRSREQLTLKVEAEYVRLYQELLTVAGLRDAMTP